LPDEEPAILPKVTIDGYQSFAYGYRVRLSWKIVGLSWARILSEFFEAMKKQCDRCSGKFFRRLNRKGYLERVVLPALGFFPWECALCRRKVVLRTDGFKPQTKPVVTSTPSTPMGWLAASFVFAGRKHRQ
jgi:hypothetical protein